MDEVLPEFRWRIEAQPDIAKATVQVDDLRNKFHDLAGNLTEVILTLHRLREELGIYGSAQTIKEIYGKLRDTDDQFHEWASNVDRYEDGSAATSMSVLFQESIDIAQAIQTHFSELSQWLADDAKAIESVLTCWMG